MDHLLRKAGGSEPELAQERPKGPSLLDFTAGHNLPWVLVTEVQHSISALPGLVLL